MTLEWTNGFNRIRDGGDSGFSVVVAGDCCPWENAIDLIRERGGGQILRAVKPFIDGADLRMIQFEAPLTDKDSPIDKSGPNLRCPVVCRELLRNNFDVALLANNHIGDHGGDACRETIRALNEIGVKTVGAGNNLEEASRPLRLEIKGLRVAVLNFAEHEFGSATPTDPGCAVLEPLDNIAAIKSAGAESDLVFVVVHGGHEFNPFPSPRMIRVYRAFAEAGASLVVNIHAHCPEGVEIHRGVPIAYCPGNFYFPWKDLTADHLKATWWLGYLPKFHCDGKGVHGIEFMPYRFDNQQIHSLSEGEAEGFFQYLNRISKPLAEPGEPERLFNVWAAAGAGRGYLNALKDNLANHPGNWRDREFVRKMLPPRNLFSCESHRDLMEAYLRLIERYELGRHEPNFPS